MSIILHSSPGIHQYRHVLHATFSKVLIVQILVM
ncbi:hypothetical protein BLA29_014311 [Euroglyphus maynei]|uniref:Uncharacterized protein n=1 Tax=Euroglyphus maynei TaxID=6958 RepID=A0A1Y3BLJ5_EURMA|nr:hypothetical protein BLA29_014311 [Euroglyphus maynei]